MSSLAAACVDLCRALSIDRCHVVGHSLGGMVALQFTLDAPVLVQSLSIINSTSNGKTPWPQRMILRAFIHLFGMKAFARVNAKLHLPGAEHEALRKRFINMMGACSAQNYLVVQRAVEDFDISSRLPEISCPVLVTHSTGDLIPLADKELIASRAQHGRLVTIKDSRHIAPWDQPDRLNQVLLDFLSA